MNTKFCHKCGAKIPKNSKFCEKCGADQNLTNPQRVVINNYNSSPNGNNQVIGSSNPVGFVQAFKLFWTNFGNFGGISSRSEYWFWILWQFIIIVATWFIAIILTDQYYTSNADAPNMPDNIFILIFLLALWLIACIIPTLSLTARRLRDMGTNTTAIILLIVGEFVPFLNFFIGIAILIMTLMPSVKQQ